LNFSAPLSAMSSMARPMISGVGVLVPLVLVSLKA